MIFLAAEMKIVNISGDEKVANRYLPSQDLGWCAWNKWIFDDIALHEEDNWLNLKLSPQLVKNLPILSCISTSCLREGQIQQQLRWLTRQWARKISWKMFLTKCKIFNHWNVFCIIFQFYQIPNCLNDITKDRSDGQ